MIKYYHFARMAFADYTNNRLRLFTRFLVYMLLAWVMIAMWNVIYQSGYGPKHISQLDMGWYNGIAQMMFFLSPRLFVIIDEDVRSGNIGYFLNRPLPYLWMRLSEGLGALSVHVLMFYTCGIAFLYLYLGDWPSYGLGALAWSLVFILIGSVIHLLFQICCGLSTFWTNDAVFIYHAYQKIILLLGGIYIPLSLYPAYMHPDVIQLLPFAAMVGAPSAVLLGEGNLAAILLLQVFWIGAVMVCLHYIYGVCLRKVEVSGG